MSNPRAPVAVVIVSWNSTAFLPDCLDSLAGLRRPPAETVVVDNASTDGSAELVRTRYPDVRLIPESKNVGFCRANNLGFRASDSPFVLALNPDTRLRPDYLEACLGAFDEPRVGMVAGKLLRFDGQTIDSAGQQLARSRKPLDRGYGQADRGQLDRDEEVFGVCGAAALYRREMLEGIGLSDGEIFDERFFAFYEDLDLAWRARRAGWKALYRHRAVGFHARGGSAAGGGWLRRWASMLGRSEEVRYHVVKNRYLTIIRNESVAGYLSHVPFIWSRDVATLMLLLITSPGVLARLWRTRRIFFDMWRRRRLDEAGFEHQF